MIFNKQKQPQPTIYDKQEPIPQKGRCSSFYYRTGTFSPATRQEDERYMQDTEAVLIGDGFKTLETVSKAKIYEATPLSSARFEFAAYIVLDDRSFLICLSDVPQFGHFMQNFGFLIPWIQLYLPESVKQFVSPYKPINTNNPAPW